ncbi:MAG TPA: Ig-like domain-containing protein [Pyrinomonadaceae bacterium]|nr:Ig-like domain-containing protein [Pyrinomonadaceae bacterium]
MPRLYVNGVHVRTGIAGLKSFVHAVPSDIGGHNYGFFDGEMDDLRVYGRALTAAEVQHLPVLNSVNAAPSVSLTSPLNGAAYNAPVNVELAAEATDDSALNKVEFFANGQLIATRSEAPYVASWGNVAAGTYTVTARATDDAGVSTTSAAVQFTVNQQSGTPVNPPAGSRLITADVVAFDQVIVYNRLGAINPYGMMYALRRDVVPIDPSKGMVPGNVQLRKDKRPRPIVLRMNAGDRLQVRFQNLLSPSPADDNQPATRTASVHAAGLQLVNNILDDGSNVGRNQSSLVAPGGSATYTFFAEREGNHLMYSTAATTGGEGDGGSLSMGLFGSVNVEPKGAEWYRSQLTAQELAYATAGRTPTNQPIINYDAKYPAGHPRAGQYVLRMLDDGLNVIHADLNAIITGPNKGRFPAGTYRSIDRVPDRDQPFREFTVVYHDEIKAVQAFPQFFEDPVLSHTLHSVRDSFAINYGTGGIGAEILANRLGVGPMADCTECKYEEFFLSAWVVGDPAQVVDVPASTQVDQNGQKIAGAPRASRVFYPDDPSNVHHSYLNDHVKMRVVHAGPKEHHVHHLHAHQWLRTPDSNDSSYLDSQALGPGYSFTTEIAHGGSGNLNKTIGDSIFHCHFYPHFAQGMWALWRVHDVFEAGTELGADGRPAGGGRKLPDAEIAAGTPIPALVPLPTLAMAPMPSAAFQGYPFYIPGVAGHRPPKPPLDTVDDGGLPRHIVTGGTFVEQHTRLDFHKELLTAAAVQLDEGGTAAELAAMQFHGTRAHASYTPAGAAASFIANGLPRKDTTATGARRHGAMPGAPFSDPCVDAQGNAVGARRVYKGANIQLNLRLNKAGWHFPQSRISVLWDDVRPTLGGLRAPEPLFFRAHTNDCIEFFHTNLVPHEYKQDDFQVRTPTDLMGQHIHLVKFDVTASDGSANGWNYEDGTFSPGEVQERVHAINALGGLLRTDGTRGALTLRQHPSLGLSGKDEDGNGIDDWLGAQTTVQRWYAESPSLRTVFTHDHFGPSTHQQAGLYAGLVIEPAGSIWKHNETGVDLNTRHDGGPTTWQAAIIDPAKGEGYREFLLEFSDFQLAYRPDGTPVNPPAKKEIPLGQGNWLVETAPQCPGGVPRPCPEAVSADDVGTMSVNYRNEPVALRVRNPQTNTQAAGEAGDLSHVFRSNVKRADPAFNLQPSVYPPLTGDVAAGDPFTPMMRAYEHDRVQIQVLVGGFEEGHNFGVHGIKWLFEPDEKNSGYRSNQMMGISEHFEFIVPKLAKNSLTTDYLYQPGQATDDAWNGLWGLMRAYSQARPDLVTLPNNRSGFGPAVSNPGDFNGVCPKNVVTKTFEVSAVAAGDALPGGTLVYNPRSDMGGQLHDPTAILFVRNTDLDPLTGKLRTERPEPLILRANAGDCIEVKLTNRLPSLPPDLNGYNTLPMIVEKFNNNNVAPSAEVGLHPQLLHYNVNRSNGINAGFNAVQTAKPGATVTYQWYAGDISIDTATGFGTATPIEFGAINLTSSDPIKHGSKGAVGALIIEPQGATWIEDANTRAQATVSVPGAASFREFVLLFQNDLNLRYGARSDAQGRPEAVPNTAEAEDAEDSGQKAFNYRTEPLWKRMGFEPDTPLEQTRSFDFTRALSNSQVGGDPVTPVFTAAAGQPVRMRILMPAGHARNNVFHLHGHIWEEEPYVNDSKTLGANPLSEWKGAQYGIGPGSHFDLLLKNGAGGRFQVRGDYLFRTMTSFQFDAGLWGIFRVQ